jgi:hypothetical protein
MGNVVEYIPPLLLRYHSMSGEMHGRGHIYQTRNARDFPSAGYLKTKGEIFFYDEQDDKTGYSSDVAPEVIWQTDPSTLI